MVTQLKVSFIWSWTWLALDTMCTKVMLPYCYVDEAAAYDGYDDYSIKVLIHFTNSRVYI